MGTSYISFSYLKFPFTVKRLTVILFARNEGLISDYFVAMKFI
jgi:hypothetical protein